ncbi:MAG: hypothetical protein WBI21_05550 [Natronincolaceae bacterium]|nr:hypothetical protein [Bacillota bacterium]NLK90524.1 hypothetical protein [Clostridiales bacterium]
MDLSDYSPGRSSGELKERVEIAQNIEKERYAHIEGVNCNAQMTPSSTKKYCYLEDDSKKWSESFTGDFRARGYITIRLQNQVYFDLLIPIYQNKGNNT